jgi:hypothetical protein
MKSFSNSIIIVSISFLIIFLAYRNIDILESRSGSNLNSNFEDTTISVSNDSNKNNLTASISYRVPNSTQSIDVTLTIDNFIIKNVNTKHSMKGESREYQQSFESDYKKFVVGKDIREIKLSRISGASLTTEAFNQAINQIKKSL